MFTASEFPNGLADFLGVSHLSGATNAMQWSMRHGSMGLISAGQVASFADKPSTLKRMLSPAFDPRATVYLPSDASSEISITNGTEAKIVSQKIEAHRLWIEVEATEPSLVVIANTHYKPWRALVNNQPTRIWRANYAFQAVQVPAGRHHLELRYIDWSFRLGCVLSIATLTLSVGALVYGWKRTHEAARDLA